MAKILVTPRSVTKNGHPSLDALTKAGHEVIFCTPGQSPSEEELVSLLPGCGGYLAGVEKISARVLESAAGLKVISRNGTGIDNVDLHAAQRLGIKVCRAEGANARGVAELTIALMLSLARSVPFSDRGFKNNSWLRREGAELEGKTLGLLGCGKIGRIVAGLALAFGMKVIAYDIFQDEAYRPSPDFQYAAFDQVLAGADYLSLHCPAKNDGSPLLDADAIARMKKGAFIINTARAGLIDEKAVLEALESGSLGGAAVDVFEPEPPSDFTFALSDKVVATPHIGGFTKESVSRAMTAAVDNLLDNL